MDPIGRTRAAALAVLVTFGCSPEAEAPDAPRTSPTPESIATGLRPGIQIEGQPPTRFTIEERLAHHNVPGVSVALLDEGELAWAAAWGMADAERGIPATTETLFQAASISKPVAALGALNLVEEGTLALDGPINAHLTSWQVPENEFTADSAVTLRRILTHTAGLTVWGFPGYRRDQTFGSGRAVATNVEVLEGTGNTPAVRVYRTPGIGWQYSGGGYTVMEEAMENVTGRPFHEVMRDRVLGPAGMARSTYEQPLPEARWPEAARAHSGSGDRVEGEWHSYPEQAAAGLWTTPSEMLRLSAHLLAILDGQETAGVVSRETLLAMLTPHRAGEEGFGDHGLGFSVEGEGDALSFGHGGSNRGFRAMWTVFPERGQGVMVMTNGDRGGSLGGEIIRAVAEGYDWPRMGPQVRRVADLTSDALEEYAGSYDLEGPEPLTLTLRTAGGALVTEVPGPGTVTLHPDAELSDTFFDPTDGLEVVFHRGDDGSVEAFVFQGQSRFVRR
jgi:CubicO group peptidase (beta-lactamase class C family)